MPTDIETWKRIKAERAAAAKASKPAEAPPDPPVEHPAPAAVDMTAAAIAARAKAEQAGKIEAMLSDAQARLQLAEVAHEAAAFDAATAEDAREADQRLAVVRQELDQAREKVTSLTSALSVARRAAVHAAALAEAQHRADQVAKVEDILSRRDAAAVVLSEHLADVVAEFRAVLALNGEAIDAYPGAPPIGAYIDRSSFVRAVQAELYRLSADPPKYGNLAERTLPLFPGSNAPNLMLAGQPSAIPSLVDSLAAASAYTIQTLRDGLTSVPAQVAAPIKITAPVAQPQIVATGPTMTAAEIQAGMPKINLALSGQPLTGEA